MAVRKFIVDMLTEVLGLVEWGDLADDLRDSIDAKLVDVDITSSDGSASIVQSGSPTAPVFDVSVASTPVEDLPLTIHEVEGAEFTVVSNSSKFSRSGNRVFVMIDVTFTFPDGDLLGDIIGLPYALAGPEFATHGLVIRESGLSDLAIARPGDDGAIRLYAIDGTFYHPSYVEDVTGDYRVIVEFFYYTNGDSLNAIYVQDFESEELYVQDFESEEIYYSTI